MKKKILSVFLIGLLVFAGCSFFNKTVDINYVKKITLITQGVTPVVADTVANLPIGAQIDLKDSTWFTKVRANYDFLGVFTQAEGGTRIDENLVFTLEANETTLYLRWKKNTVNVTFVTQNVTPSVADIKKDLRIGAKINLNDSTAWFVKAREGYDFLGIFDVATGGTRIDENLAFTVTATMTNLYVRWMPKAKEGTVNVTVYAPNDFISGGQTIVQLPVKEGVNLKEFLTTVAFEKTGFTFDGVFAAQAGGTRIDNDLVITVSASTTALYLRWTEKPKETVKVTFITKGVTPAVADIEKTWIVGTKIDLKDSVWFVKARDGYTLDGIFTTETGGTRIDENLAFTVAATMTNLYVRWTASTGAKGHIKFEVGEGGGTAPATIEFASPVEITLPGQGAMTAPEGKVFVGWTPKTQVGNEWASVYPAGYKITFRVSEEVFVAQWWVAAENDVHITFDKGEGGGTAPAPIHTRAKIMFQLPGQGAMTAPEGKTFAGWKNIRGVEVIPGGGATAYSQAANETYVAQWVRDGYKSVSIFGVPVGDNARTLELKIGESVNLATVLGFSLERYGYVFDGLFANGKETRIDTTAAGVFTVTATMSYVNIKWTKLPTNGKIYVKFNLNGGSGTPPEPITFEADGSSNNVTIPGQGAMVAPAGKVFVGWNLYGDDLIEPGSTYGFGREGYYEFRAVWETPLYPLDKDITAAFTDENFRNAVYGEIGKSAPAPILYGDVRAVRNVNMGNRNISSLAGIEYFTHLYLLDVFDNHLTTLDLSANKELAYLNCGENNLTSLNLTNKTKLYHLDCCANNLTTLNVTGLTMLWQLNVSDNKFASEAAIIGLDKSRVTQFTFGTQRP